MDIFRMYLHYCWEKEDTKRSQQRWAEFRKSREVNLEVQKKNILEFHVRWLKSETLSPVCIVLSTHISQKTATALYTSIFWTYLFFHRPKIICLFHQNILNITTLTRGELCKSGNSLFFSILQYSHLKP
jgi:hypothetical protein